MGHENWTETNWTGKWATGKLDETNWTKQTATEKLDETNWTEMGTGQSRNWTNKLDGLSVTDKAPENM